jgi:hypothetical protein
MNLIIINAVIFTKQNAVCSLDFNNEDVNAVLQFSKFKLDASFTVSCN